MDRAASKAAHMSAPDHGPHRSRRFLLLPKGRPHMSQTLAQGAGWTVPTPVSHFVNLWKTEADREEPVLLANGPRAGKAEPPPCAATTSLQSPGSYAAPCGRPGSSRSAASVS